MVPEAYVVWKVSIADYGVGIERGHGVGGGCHRHSVCYVTAKI